MELYSVGVVLDCLHPAEENTFYKGIFMQRLHQMSDAEFEVFCTEVRQLAAYYAFTREKWHTDRIDCFTNVEEDFYRIPFPLSQEASVETIEHPFKDWAFDEYERTGKVHFINDLRQANNEQVYLLFNNILQLEAHRAYAVNLFYTDRPLAVVTISSVQLDELLTQFAPIQWDEPLRFRIRRKPNK